KADLYQDRRLVPVDMLVHNLVALERDDADQRYFDVTSGGGNARQHPLNLAVVGKAHNAFVHDAIGTHRSRNGDRMHVGGVIGYEVVAIEAMELDLAVAADQGGNMIDVRLGNHGRHGRVGVTRD